MQVIKQKMQSELLLQTENDLKWFGRMQSEWLSDSSRTGQIHTLETYSGTKTFTRDTQPVSMPTTHR